MNSSEEDYFDWGAPAGDLTILGWTLKLTCGACPEQYDVFTESGEQVGYLRLRHGTFRADYPDCGGETVYLANPQGDGIFEQSERAGYLYLAVQALQARHNEIKQGS